MHFKGGANITLLAVKLKKLKNSIIATRYICLEHSTKHWRSSASKLIHLYNTLFRGKSGRTQHCWYIQLQLQAS